ncbi:MAG: glutamate racemase, partial [Lachnospiraceae bacterium]|nr:glutamate racemase [Lachnospiraceae bacterium]
MLGDFIKRTGKAPIAVFDSGVGGISVLRELIALMPQENFYYYGDSANAPHGTKGLEEVRKLPIGHVDNFIREG